MKELIKDRIGKTLNVENLVFVILFAVVLLILVVPFGITQEADDRNNLVQRGTNWERNCEDGGCQITLYSYQKYYVNEGDEWEQIDENFGTENCEQGYDVCVDRNLYQVHVKSGSDSAETIKYVKDGVALTFQPLALNYRDNSDFEQRISDSGRRTVDADDNIISYDNIFGNNIHLRYAYLPDLFKQELILEDVSVLPEVNGEIVGNDITLDLDFKIGVDRDTGIFVDGEAWNSDRIRTSDPIVFRLGAEEKFALSKPFAIDSRGQTIGMDHEITLENNEIQVRIKTPYEWLVNNATYPVIIDPTVEINNINDDGAIKKEAYTFPPDYLRSKPKSGSATLGLDGFYVNRWLMEWNLSSVLDNANISDVTLQLFVDSAEQTDFINISHMEGGFDDYADTDGDCEGNCHLYSDMGNGTQYSSHIFSNNVTNEFLNLSFNNAGASDLESALSGDVFNTGLHNDGFYHTLSIARRTNSNESKRPKLIINASKIVPQVFFVDPTPANDTLQEENSIFVNVSSIDDTDHSVVVDFDRDLLLWFNMDEVNLSEDPIDLSTYENNASAVGGAQLNDDGYYGWGYIFDGDDGYLNLGTIPAGHPLQLTEEFTISTWFYSDISGDRYGRVIDKSDGSQAENGWAVYRDNNLRTIRMDVNGSGRITSSVTYTYQEWTHAVFVNNGSAWKLYMDGVEDTGATVSNYQQAPDVETTARIGTWNHATAREWSGKLDEIAIFNRALSGSEILSLYNASATQYENNFTNLEDKNYNFTAYAIDLDGYWSSEDRTVEIGIIPANESEGDAAIEEGINNILSGISISSDQLIYLVNETGDHSTGYFDKVVREDNQAWAFNYVYGAESFTNMPSLFKVLNVWENSTLNYESIVSQVENFINSTIY